MIDLRSDTMTKPTPEMRVAMANAEVGDDVFGEDPTLQRLEARVAGILGKEAALFVPSGSMGNQIGVRLHCAPGDEFLCEADCHIFNYEQATYAQLFGLAVQPIQGDCGVLSVDQLRDRVRPDNDHAPRTKLICLENTHNRGAGRIQPYETVVEICQWAKSVGLARHMDGARLWNAAVATDIPPARWAQHFDTVSVCFSKGLGAPVGSAIVGSKDHIHQARRLRKAMGGGMRQAGILGAAALYALDHHIDRLVEDHQKAQLLAEAIRESPRLKLVPEEVDTNLVIFEIEPKWGTAAEFVGKLKERGVLALAVAKHRVRLVTHLDVSEAQVGQARDVILEVSGFGK
ncbi:MAG: GntG family PLP-dependent aldolase [Pirellulales bacterium]